jgi:hypothetical protein
MSNEIYQLQIHIHTKIPSHSDIILSNDILVHTVKKPLEKYPLFSYGKLYPRRKLQQFNYDEVVTFFFNQNRFKTILQPEIPEKNTDIDPNYIKYSNFILMLQLLFPISFPLVNNIETSLSYRLPNNKAIGVDDSSKLFSFKGANISWLKILPSKFNQKFSYLKLDNNIYTITHTIWLNDVMNHPIYREIIKSYNIFQKWKQEYFKDIENKYTQLEINIINKINKLINQKFNPLELNTIDIDRYYGSKSIILNKYNESIQELNKIKQEGKSNIFNTSNPQELKKIIKEFINITNIYLSVDRKEIFSDVRENLNIITKVVRDYDITRSIHEYIEDLNFEYLNKNEYSSNAKLEDIYKTINSKYYEFNEFVSKIKNMQTRKIDNPTWSNVITKIIKGEMDHGFQDIWNTISRCYNMETKESVNEVYTKPSLNKKSAYEKEKKQLEIAENEKKEKEAQQKRYDEDLRIIEENKKREEAEKKRKQAEEIRQKAAAIRTTTGGAEQMQVCNNTKNELNVGFDMIYPEKKNDSEKKISELRVIEIYLQMDIVKGQVTEQNLKAVKCMDQDFELGNMLKNLLYNSDEMWNVSKQILYLDATKELDEYNEKLKKTDKKEQKPQNTQKKQGGIKSKSKSKTRKIHK